MLRYGTADYAVFQNFLWEVSVGILSRISLKNLSGQRLVMPCQVPSVTIGPEQQENGFLVKARNEYLGGVNAAPGLQPSTQESALLSFPLSIPFSLLPSIPIGGLSPFQMLQLWQTKKARNEMPLTFRDQVFLLSWLCISESFCFLRTVSVQIVISPLKKRGYM